MNTFDLTIKHNLHVGMQNAINQIMHLEKLLGIANREEAHVISATSEEVVSQLENNIRSLSLIEPEGEQPNEAIEFAKFIASYETEETEEYYADRLTLVDGDWYFYGDDRDKSIPEEVLYEWFKNSKAVTLSEASNHSFQQAVEWDEKELSDEAFI